MHAVVWDEDRPDIIIASFRSSGSPILPGGERHRRLDELQIDGEKQTSEDYGIQRLAIPSIA